MKTVVATQAEVPTLLPMDECIELMARALSAHARGDVVLPLRSLVRIPDGSGILGLMPGWLGEPACFGLKAVSVMPGNHGTAYDAHQGAVLLFEVEHGSLVAVVDGSAITKIRTGAASGLATRLLAREDAGDLAILGSGVQAESHLAAMKAVRTLRRVRVWSRNPDHVRRFAERESARHGIAVEPMPDARAAVEGADLICTTTSARAPLLEGARIAPGAHINAAGACFKDTRELDTAAVKRARLYVDARESALNEAGDFLLAKAEGAIGDDHIVAEIGEVLIGRAPGRSGADEITLFESLGIAIEDLASAHHIWRRALDGGGTTVLDFGGLREAPAVAGKETHA